MSNRYPSASLEWLLERARLEILPTASVAEQVHAHVEPGRTVTVTASPAKGLEATLAVTEQLADRYHVVPHLAARMIQRDHLPGLVEHLQGLGVTEVFVPGGDAVPTETTFTNALDLLVELEQMGRPFERVGITGYPESHPGIDDDVIVQSMWDKRRYATDIVSNMTFDDEQVGQWLERVRRRGIEHPVWVGVPGPVDPAKLLRMASMIGVGDSVRFLRKQRGVFARIALPGFSTTRFVRRIAALAGTQRLNIGGLHLYSFNQIEKTEAWRREQLGAVARLRDRSVGP
ncbi:5,10-methylenetetrahydrofolate reductase [Serinicoccus chungangensis]|uniref:Methylenetetrahydrofolate reductase n=1 Tax=Serinicoccus chungangensis TaxID=767452 RepID=A0A0W8IB42_9MICO|nr:methylenetetrahydrofolate reductase [Serinicoccus chungangensis]KUG57171.1 5,10-methylenetetrahydrofolate reductase [Serinicoccus chungangensis]